MEAPWIAVYVQTTRPLTIEAEKRLKKNITLAQELGAELVTTTDDDIVSALVRVAQQNNVTQIVVGKSMTGLFDNLLHGGSLVNRLIRESGRIDIYVVQGDAAARRSPPAHTARRPFAFVSLCRGCRRGFSDGDSLSASSPPRSITAPSA